ncbi:MAG: RiPP maturation radical SAM C-methyltransferase [Proteobacteria bacterium]|nr:RiPP maturation radical SAM C-methyltransferase [Pseudomonadota bacterium]MBU1057716.1 RiPP maturation radical SAM C-methyltransferase [Pseudomonadota bacterium]
MKTNNKHPFRLGLVSMPWSIFNRPSIQLAALKAYLDQNSSVATTLYHPYLAAAAAVGTETYHYLAKNSWAGEALYSPLLFPEQSPQAEQLFYESCREGAVLKQLNFQVTSKILSQNLDQWISSVKFETFDLFGFSICFNQLLSSLTAAARIKKQFPNLPIVIGGSGCVDKIGVSFLRHFPQIDYVINGEGEEALKNLCQFLANPDPATALPAQILNRETTAEIPDTCGAITDLNTLPAPDYSPYFQEMHHCFPRQSFIPVLPLEFSRGCWWNKCTFCNLNLQWKGYRWKKAKTLREEVIKQSRRHQCLDFCFTDNALPPKETNNFFQLLAKEQKDYDFFAEVRVITDSDTPALYRRGGLSTVQVGIESLSSSLLKKMNKGTSAIENIAAMRQSAEAGMRLDGNLITEFPGSSEEEMEETLKNLDFVLPFAPLSNASFFLGHGSPVAKNPSAYGIKAITQHPKNRKLFPPELLQDLDMLIKDYRGDRVLQRRRWQPVQEKIRRWQLFHEQRNSRLAPLSYRDGGTFLLIRQEQINGPILRHRLQEISRKIYLFCCEIRSQEEILKTFTTVGKITLLKFLQDLTNKKLFFKEGDRYLALAIRQVS